MSIEPRTFEPLRLGEITPRGWLERQLRIQADGLTGRIEQLRQPFLDSRWRGGTHGGHEQEPYYLDGLVPLSFLLEDDELIEHARQWIDTIIDGQDEYGWLGPVVNTPESASGYRPPYLPLDRWPRYVLLKALRQFHEATDDEEVLEAMCRLCKHIHVMINEQPLYSWSKYRWGDFVSSIHWLYERTDEEWLLDLAEEVIQQGYDWIDHFETFPYEDPYSVIEADDMGGERFYDSRHQHHIVTNAMAVKIPAVTFRQTGLNEHRVAAETVVETLDRYHGQVIGTFSGDEHLAGRNPSRGVETCAVVEYLHSLEELVAQFGEPVFGDRLERIAYNALPAAFDTEMEVLQYYQYVNQVFCTDHDDLLHAPPAFGTDVYCCTANYHQGWPKFAASLWMHTQNDGLATVAYAPCEVTTSVADGVSVTLTEETDYPFDETVSLTVDPSEPVSFPLSLRIPQWATEPTITLPGEQPRVVEPGTYHTITREWTSRECVELTFPMELAVERRYRGGVAVRRGPIVFALNIDAEWRSIDDTQHHERFELIPREVWNYGLDIDPDHPTHSMSLRQHGSGEYPFSSDKPPLELDVDGRQLPTWAGGKTTSEEFLDASERATSDDDARIRYETETELPESPVTSECESERLTLVPYGCTSLRMTEFPRERSE